MVLCVAYESLTIQKTSHLDYIDQPEYDFDSLCHRGRDPWEPFAVDKCVYEVIKVPVSWALQAYYKKRCVCLSVCPVHALTFETLNLETPYLIRRCIFKVDT